MSAINGTSRTVDIRQRTSGDACFRPASMFDKCAGVIPAATANRDTDQPDRERIALSDSGLTFMDRSRPT